MFKSTHRYIAVFGGIMCTVQMGLLTAQTTAQTLAKPERGEPMRAQWSQADLDKDGQLSKAEAQAAGMRHLVDHFDAMDLNKDGKISEAEVRSWMQGKHMTKAAAAPQGQAAAGSPPPQGAARSTEKEGMGFKSPDQRRAEMQERFNKADTNKDGGLSRAELQAAGMQRLLDHFDAIDTNKDGKITQEEMRAAWEKRQ